LKGFKYFGDKRYANYHAVGGRVHAEHYKEFMIVEAHAAADPWAMVVHHECAAVAGIAMVGSIGFDMLALGAKFELVPAGSFR
jgi:hypothetical protein